MHYTLILMVISSLAASASSLVRDNNRILSKASEAFEISSLKKIFKEKDNQTMNYILAEAVQSCARIVLSVK